MISTASMKMLFEAVVVKLKDSKKMIDRLEIYARNQNCRDFQTCIQGNLDDLEELELKLKRAKKCKVGILVGWLFLFVFDIYIYIYI